MNLRKQGEKFILYVALLMLLIWALGPIYWVFISSISTRSELYITPIKHWIPQNSTIENYIDIFTTGPRYRGTVSIPSATILLAGIRNSLIISVMTAAILSLLGLLTGYAFSRLKFWGKNLLFIIIIAMMPLPIWISLIHLYLLISTFGLIDNIFGIIIVSVAYGIPLYIWLMKTYMDSVPTELEDAARVDGCSRLSSLFMVVLPVVKPGVTSVFLVAFLSTWGSFLVPLIFSNTTQSQPLTVVLSLFIGQYDIAWNAMAAAVTVTIIPSLALAFFFQRYLVRGLTMGALKE